MSYAVMPLTDWQSILNSVKAKTGKSDALVSGVVSSEIDSISGGSDETSESYVKAEALAVANRIDASNGTFKMVFVTDLHNMDDVPRLEHANQAIQALCRVNDIDCVVFGGDYIRNWTEITKEEAIEDIRQCRDKLKNQIVPTIWCRGNHDTNGYVGERLTKEEAYNLIANKNVDNGAVINAADPHGNYGYVDFADKKVRVIFVNTSDNDFIVEKEVDNPETDASALISSHNITVTQLQWIADVALSFTESGWNVIFVSHAPLYWSTGSSPAWFNNHTTTDGSGVVWTCNLSNMSNLIKAYINKTSFSTTLNGATASKNFSSLSHYATIASGISGHQHAFLVNTDELVNYISVGNACEGGKASADGNSYPKVDNTADDTTFDIIDFDFANQEAYCWNYGAGYDRVVPFRYSAPNVAVTGVSLSATSGKLQVEGTVTLVANVVPANATNRKVNWTSSNNSVATVANGVVTAKEIGNAVITATTEDGGFTATYALTVEAKPITNIIDTIGYEDGVRLNSSGTTTGADGYTATGMIDISAYPDPVVVRTKGVNFTKSTSCYIVLYNASGAKIANTYIKTMVENGTAWNNTVITADADGNLVITTQNSNAANYFRISGYGSGANLIVTINEEIP